jgi:two-component system, sporulation sensor kinase E
MPTALDRASASPYTVFMPRPIGKIIRRLDSLIPDPVKHIIERIHNDNILMESLLNSDSRALCACGTKNQLIYANTAARRLLNIAAPKSAKPLWKMIGSKALAAAVKNMLLHNISGISEDFPYNGQFYNIEARPLALQGRLSGNILIIHNITQLRQEQTRIRRQESFASIAKMAAIVAHEIKNPLGALSIHIQLLARAVDAETYSKEMLQDFLNIFNEEITRLDELTTNYLKTSKPLELMMIQLNAGHLLNEVLMLMQTKLQQENIKVQCLVPPSLPLILADPNALKQIFVNLINNAVRAMSGGGQLTFSFTEDEKYLQISVTDTGEGIKEEIQGQIFTPYFTTSNSGSGLGLTLVYQIMHNHGGDIKLFSPPPGAAAGTQFILYFPKSISTPPLLLPGSS